MKRELPPTADQPGSESGLHDQLAALRRSTIARNSAWTLGAQGLRLVLQLLMFAVVSRALGASGFGAFAGAQALVMILAPFAAWGSGNVLIMRSNRGEERVPVGLSNALLSVALFGSLLTVVVILAGSGVLGFSARLLCALAVAEFFCGSVVNISGQAYQSVENLRMTAALAIGLSGARALAAVALVSGSTATPQSWAMSYLLASFVVATISLLLAGRRFGVARPKLNHLRNSFRQGLYFSVGLSASTLYNDIDKTMLASLSTLSAAGIYAAAYRVVNMTFVPISSLLAASYARFFREGSRGIRAAAGFSSQLLPYSFTYGLSASVALYLAAPIVPRVLGAEYQPAVAAVRLLAAMTVLRSLHYFGADTLTGAGFQGIRSALQVSVAALNVGLNLWLIPLYSWKGAAVATIATDAALLLAIWSAVFVLSWRPRLAVAP